MRSGFFAGLALLMSTGVAAAQTTPPPATAATAPQAPGGRGRRAQAAAAAQQAAGTSNPVVALATVQNMLDGYILKQAQAALQLSDTQYGAFLPKMDALQKLRRAHQKEHIQLINQLNQAAPPPRAGLTTADEATIAARVRAVDDAEAQMVTDERAALAAVDSVLTTYQRARFRAFEENMEREKLRLLAIVMAQPGAPQPAPNPVPDSAGSL